MPGSSGTGELRVLAAGIPLAVVAAVEDLPRLRRQWARCRTDLEPTDTLTHGPTTGPGSGDAADYDLTVRVTIAGIGGGIGTRLALHAAGLVADDGGVLALVAASGGGKSTASRLLARRLGYLSDETVSLGTDELDVLPYPKPVSLSTTPGSPQAAREKHQHSPDDLGLLPLPQAPLRLRRVVLLDRDPTHTEVEVQRPNLIDSLTTLLPQTSALPRLADPLATFAGLLIRTGGTVRVSYAEIDSAADAILGALEELEPGGEEWAAGWEFVHVPGPVDGTAPEERAPATPDPSAGPPTQETLVRRTPHTDALVTDDGERAMVLLGDQSLVLEGPAAVAWEATERPMSVAALTEELTARLGPDPAAATASLETVRMLLGAGLFERAEASYARS